jgi:iduronate 2-sulfatase
MRSDKWAYIQYKEDASAGIELFDVHKDPLQFTNLANPPKYASVVEQLQAGLADKLQAIRDNDLGLN